MIKDRYSLKEIKHNPSYDDFFRACGSDKKFYFIVDNKTGKEYEYPLLIGKGKTAYASIHPDLQTEEFIAWMISTTKDFINYIDEIYLTPNILEYVVNNYEYVEIFDSKSTSYRYNGRKLEPYMTKDLWEKAFKRNYKVINYIPRNCVSNDMVRKLSNQSNLTVEMIERLPLYSKLFEKIYFNCDNAHRLKLIPGYNYYLRESEKVLPSLPLWNPILFTKKIVDDILSLDITTIWAVPSKFVSKENAIKAMDTNILLIKYVPAEYQYEKYQRKVLEEGIENVKLIDRQALTDTIVYYILSKDENALSYIPNENRTIEMCMYAISKFGRALKYVPRQYKTKELCFKAVLITPSAISFVPVEILDESFINDLKKENVDIPKKNLRYVRKCLSYHKELKEVQSHFNDIFDIKSDKTLSEKDTKIRLKSLPGILTKPALSFLEEINILTVGDLLENAQTSEFQEQIKELIDPDEYTGLGVGMAPIGHRVTIVTPTELEIDIVADLQLRDDVTIGNIQSAVEAAIEAYLLNIRKNWVDNNYTSVYITQIITAIMSVGGVINVDRNTITLNGETQDIDIENTAINQYIPVLGTVELHEIEE